MKIIRTEIDDTITIRIESDIDPDRFVEIEFDDEARAGYLVELLTLDSISDFTIDQSGGTS